jgi:hypothetical protein
MMTFEEVMAVEGLFRCQCCGRMVRYIDLERWCCDFSEGSEDYICSGCYEDGMGDDL